MAGIVGFADSYAFHDGKLCYVLEDRPKRWLRILDVQKATNDEIVVDIPVLVAQAVPGSETLRKYTFRVLYHADGITSCLFSFARPITQNWLLIFNAKEHRLLGTIPLESAIRIFVRNNKDHLYFGTHSEYGDDGFRKWVLRHFDIREGHLSRDKMHLSNVVGYEIGSTVCFEIIDDHFYGCSNQTAFEIEEIDWTSYYYCFRFRVGDLDSEKAQVMKKRDSWRRQHAEGPIDDRWGFIQLEKDEVTGSIKIIECRKEWLTGRSGNRRTYYTKKVVFSAPGEVEESGDDSSSVDAPPEDDPLTNLLNSSNRPNYMEAPPRPPLTFHPGDDGSAMFTRNSTHLRSYHHSCETFLDLVDDRLPSDPSTQRIRIRSGRRVFDTLLPASHATRPNISQQKIDIGDTPDITQHNDISFWPPGSGRAKSNPNLSSLNWVMNPPGHTGNIAATGDERSIIYATSNAETGGLKALVYLSFDPSVRLTGMIRGGLLGGEVMKSSDQRAWDDNAVDRKGKGKEGCSTTQHFAANGIGMEKGGPAVGSCSLPSFVQPSSKEDLPIRVLPAPQEGLPWAMVQKSFHQDLPRWTFFFDGSVPGGAAESEGKTTS